MVLGMFSSFMGWAIVGELSFHKMQFSNNDFSESFLGDLETILPRIANVIFWYLLAPFFLITSYFKLKETEI